DRRDTSLSRPFASAGQSTQMIIGATNETDLELIRTTQNLYQAFDLKRVFYSGYIPLNEDDNLPQIGTPVPLLREHRLYQADWLMRYYGFFAEELLSKENPFLDNQLDPKCNWAIHHLEQFPIEINTASSATLLRVPGIGPTGVKKILSARRYGSVNFEMLKKMHIVLKRAQYFITCNGKMLYRTPIEERFIRNQLTDLERTSIMQIEGKEVSCTQMNLFTDFKLQEVGV
ncbi:MAG: radical SAM protein, partial [Agathobacter sp.]|nr:radical SAM protein [Agathobacter sp.]